MTNTSYRKWMAAAFCVCVLGLLGSAVAQEKALAEGRYRVKGSAAEDESQSIPVSETRWTMFELPGKGLEVRVSINLEDATVNQRFRLTPDFHLLAYSAEGKADDGASGGVSCEPGAEVIRCELAGGGMKKAASIEVHGPWMLELREFTFNPAWWLAATMAQVDRVAGKTTELNTVLVMYGYGEIGGWVDEPTKIKYVGKKKFESAFGPLECHVFESKDARFFVANSGLLIAVQDPHSSANDLELVELKDDFHRLIPAPEKR